jgi:hypothetical protein
MYHTLDGMFANGWVYKNGAITDRIGGNANDNKSGTIRRLSQTCTTYLICVYKQSCTLTLGNGILSCTPWTVDYCYTETVCEDDGNNNNGNGPEQGEGGGSIPPGGGGPYVPPPPPPPPPPQVELTADCGKLAAIINDDNIQNYMDSLITGRMLKNSGGEDGDLRRENGTWQPMPSSDNGSMKYTFEQGVKYTHTFHSHPYGQWWMINASAADLYDLWKTYNKGFMLDPSTFVYGIIGSNTSMMIKIEDTTKFENYFSGLEGTTEDEQKDNLEKKYYDVVNNHTDLEILLQELVAFVSPMGLKVVVSKNNETTNEREWYIYSDNNGNSVKINCIE